MGKGSDSIKDFDKALTFDKTYNAYAERGRAYHSDRQYEKAIQDYDRVLVEQSNDVNTWYKRGLSNNGRKQWKAAVEDFSESLSLLPNDAWTLLERAELNLKLKLPEAVSQDLNTAISKGEAVPPIVVKQLSALDSATPKK